jgi:hypothetical protein
MEECEAVESLAPRATRESFRSPEWLAQGQRQSHDGSHLHPAQRLSLVLVIEEWWIEGDRTRLTGRSLEHTER